MPTSSLRLAFGFLPRSGYTEQPRGFKPWVRWLVKGALKVAPDVGRAGGIICEEAEEASRPPLLRNMVELPSAL
jgi:hypothetical protein